MSFTGIALVYRGEVNAPVIRTIDLQGENLTVSAVSAQSGLVAISGQFWEVSPTGDVWVDFGTNPTAAAGDKIRIWANTTRHFQASAGDKIAVIDA